MSSRTHLLESTPTSTAAWASSQMDNSGSLNPPPPLPWLTGRSVPLAGNASSHSFVLPPSLLTYSEPSLDPKTQAYIKTIIQLREEEAAAAVTEPASDQQPLPAPLDLTTAAGPSSVRKGCTFAPTPTASNGKLEDEEGKGGGTGSFLGLPNPREHRDSVNLKEYHKQKQGEYRRTRRRHFTDPVDFEGILHIIGGCGWWQVWIYLLISLQQVTFPFPCHRPFHHSLTIPARSPMPCSTSPSST